MTSAVLADAAAAGGAAASVCGGRAEGSCLETGELSQAEFEIAAREFARWWSRSCAAAQGGTAASSGAAGCGDGGGGGGCAGGKECAGGPRVTPGEVTWYVMSCEQPVTGEVTIYLAAEVLLRPGATGVTGLGGAARGGGDDAGSCAACYTGRGGGSGVDGVAGDDALSLDGLLLEDDEDEAAVAPAQPGDAPAAAAAASAAGPAARLGLEEGGGAATRPGEGRAVLELHIAYHPSYRVPLLLFRARELSASGAGGASGGGSASGSGASGVLSHESLLQLLAAPLARHAAAGAPAWALVSRMPHPALRAHWAAAHPCRSAELVRLMLGGAAVGAAAGDGGGGCGGGGGAANAGEPPMAAVEAAAGEGLLPGAAPPLLRYMVAWFSAAGRAVGLGLPGPHALGAAP